MSQSEPNRSWVVGEDTFKYNYTVYKGIHPTIKGFFAHFNPGLLRRLMRPDYDIVVIGGMANPTLWLSPFFVQEHALKIMSIESNLDSSKRNSGIGAWIKYKLLKTAEVFQITGTRQDKYINHFYKDGGNIPRIVLPNLIESSLYVEKVANLRLNKCLVKKELNIDTNEKVWILPARLIKIKGILEFISCIKKEDDFHLYVLGEGELKDSITSYAKRNELSVTCIGYVSQEVMLKYYSIADSFVLPSWEDPSPLSPIEACASGLPLLVSDRIGNYEDVLSNGDNGYGFDISDSGSIRLAIEQMLNLSKEEYHNFSQNSKKRYMSTFSSEKCIREYVMNILELLNN
ncbi:MAG: glycosyltransferase family 4 protein [Vallitalea sp.]|nr:glycosyltransferase family 4 protein [Vallitalea sp.]